MIQNITTCSLQHKKMTEIFQVMDREAEDQEQSQQKGNFKKPAFGNQVKEQSARGGQELEQGSVI